MRAARSSRSTWSVIRSTSRCSGGSSDACGGASTFQFTKFTATRPFRTSTHYWVTADPKHLLIATRSSELALRQARQVQSALGRAGIAAELKAYKTSGDKKLDEPLAALDRKLREETQASWRSISRAAPWTAASTR